MARKSYAPHFALLALALLLVTLWTVWDEAVSKRPWKAYQKQFFEEAQKKFRADLETAKKELREAQSSEEYAQARAEYEAAQKAYESPEARTERIRLQGELAATQKELDAVRHRFQILRGTYQETIYHFERSRSPRLKTELERLDPEITQLSARMGQLQKQKKATIEQLGSAEQKLEEARARLGHFEDRVHQAERALAELREEKIEIRQVVNPKLNLVDRCASCHLGATRLGLESLPQPFQTHPPVYLHRGASDKSAHDILNDHPFESFGCSSCHQGQGYATASTREGHGEQEFWLTPLLRGQRVWSSCQKCHDA